MKKYKIAIFFPYSYYITSYYIVVAKSRETAIRRLHKSIGSFNVRAIEELPIQEGDEPGTVEYSNW